VHRLLDRLCEMEHAHHREERLIRTSPRLSGCPRRGGPLATSIGSSGRRSRGAVSRRRLHAREYARSRP
jgi:hypothetical protein